EKDHEYDEQDLRDLGGAGGDAGEAEDGGDDGYDEERERPAEHVQLLRRCGGRERMHLSKLRAADWTTRLRSRLPSFVGKSGRGAGTRGSGSCTAAHGMAPAAVHAMARDPKLEGGLATVAWKARPDLSCESISGAWLEFTGYTREQALGAGWSRGVHPADL